MDDNKRIRALNRRKEYEKILSKSQLKLKADKKRGRYLVASKQIAKGETILIEHPIAKVIFQDHIKLYCSYCLSSLSQHSKTCCLNCKFQANYCSAGCQKKDQNIHNMVCDIYKNIAGIAGASGTDDALIRIISLTLSNLDLDGQPLSDPVILKATGSQVKQMVSHPSMATKEWVESMNLAAADIIHFLKPKLNSTDPTIEQIIKLAMQINANSFALYDPSRQTEIPIGVGIYPISALFNHSCNPNLNYHTLRLSAAEGGQIKFTATRDILEGEEVTDTYTDIFTSFSKRQEKLLTSKHFICECSRCLDKYSPLSNMQTIVCKSCHENSVVPLEDDQSYTCNSKKNCVMNAIEINERIRNLERLIENSEDLQKLCDFNGVLMSLLKFLEISDGFLDENHHLLPPVYVQLINTSLKLNDIESMLKYSKKYFNLLDRVYSHFWPEKVPVCTQIAEVYLEALNDACEAVKWFRIAFEICTGLFGEDHTKTKSIEKRLQLAIMNAKYRE